ncbi:filamentous hemagglutinin N-terminal domain-containing protein [Halopseudomonas aestusnigri]|uniref:two-partner secretion domain-containing protein n=1 Tax=Halopseudomonas aestusnigri TaxID=857252 RepID=UPI0028C213C8|nr:hypothetical protein YSKK_22120 [Halopseudomonas aestusnigri]
MTTTRPNFAPTALAIAISLCAAQLHAANLPTGGNIVGGSGSISQDGNSLNVQQNSDRLITNWDSFDIGAGHTVNFYQPGSNSVALNRVIGEDASAIYGNLNANGKVFLVNPNGVLFGQGAAVNVGALVASTLSLSDQDFNDGNYQFSGDGNNAAVINRGTLNADQGAVALLGGQVSNHGIIQANQGTVALAAGDKITLDFAGDGLLNVTVDKGTIDALVENHQLVRANGGQVVMTANATNALLQTVVNNTGIVEAQTLDNQSGTIVLKGGFNGGTVNVAGTLDASAPDSGDGGFIDTSGAHVKIAGGTQVTTKANHGTTGEWLIDPTDFTISDSSDPQTASGIGAATLSANLENNNVTLETVDTGTEPGDMYVNGAVSWSADHTLSLNAHNDIHINQAITATNGGLTLNAGGAISANGAVNVGTFNLQSGAWSQLGSTLADFSARDFHLNTANASFLRANGGDGSDGNAYQIFDLYGLQGIASRSLLSSHVALTNNIDASGTVNWNGGAGFVPIGDWSNRYTGSFDGQGHSINDLTINRPNTDYVGLFGVIAASQISNIGLTNATITGQLGVGGLVGQGLNNSRISHSSAQGDFSAYLNGGGLAGNFDGTIEHSHSVGTVDASEISGGLVGRLVGQISDSYSTASVKGDFGGGLVGIMNGGQISRSYATGQVKKDIFGPIGGLIGSISIGTITNSYWNTETSGQASAVGLGSSAGSTGLTTAQMFDAANFSGFDFADTWANADNQTTPYLRALAGNRVFNKNDLPTGTINATNRPALYTVIQNVEQLQAMRDNLSANYLLGNDIDATATASWNGGAGFDPLGVSNNSFSGQLDGMGYIVDGLTIQHGDQLGVGLFGYTTADSQIRNLGLTDVNIQGQSFVGSLVGKSLGLLDGVFATGRVGGDFVVGGLAGSSQGSITESYAATDIEAFSIAGGLVGSQGPGIYDSATRTRSTSSVDNSYATGTIKVTVDPASGSAGGLVGMLDGAISNSYSTVIINETSAGLVGSATQGVFTNVYYANTDRDGNTLDTAGLDFGGRSWAKMTQLDAFNTWGSDIDAEGGTGAIWRIYEGHSTPMLRRFLTALEVAGENSTTTYNGTEQGGSWDAAGEYDADRIFGQPIGGKNAGTYALDMSGLYSNQQGYDLITTGGGTLTINKAKATVTANSGTTTYNGTEQSVSGFTVDGLVNGEDQSVLTGVTTSGGKGTNAGSYTLTASGTDGNYELSFVNGTLTIERKAITGNITADGKTYDGSTYANTHGILDGVISGDDLQFNTTGAFADRHVGTGKQVTVSGSLGGGDAGNYVLTTNSSTTANIDRKTITADIRALDKLFDGSLAATLEGVLNGTISGDDVALQLSGLFASLTPGENRVLVDASLTGADAGNYQLVTPDSVTANMQGFVQSEDYQSANVSQPPESRQLSAPGDTGYQLDVDDDALHLPMASR